MPSKVQYWLLLVYNLIKILFTSFRDKPLPLNAMVLFFTRVASSMGLRVNVNSNSESIVTLVETIEASSRAASILMTSLEAASRAFEQDLKIAVSIRNAFQPIVIYSDSLWHLALMKTNYKTLSFTRILGIPEGFENVEFRYRKSI